MPTAEIPQRVGRYFHIPPGMQERIKNDLCPICGKPRNEWGHKRWSRCCSPDCTQKFNAECWHDWSCTRWEAARAAGYRCQHCGKDLLQYPQSAEKYGRDAYLYFFGIVDHIKPIALGGEEFDLSNCQLLCDDCNRKKTKVDQGEIAKFRKRNCIKRRDHPHYGYSPDEQASLESFV